MIKIALGTAQIGIKYGIKNKFKKIKEKESSLIINNLKKHNINYIDTARYYGNAEEIIGNNNTAKIKIITKIPKLDLRKNVKNQINNHLYTSLIKLKKNKIYAALLHDENQIKSKKGKIILEELQKLKYKKLVSKVGISLYDPKTIYELNRMKFIPDIVQIPYSIMDRRFDKDNLLNKLKKQNIEIHVRSIFLQGLLLMNLNNLDFYFKNFKSDLMKIHKIAESYRISVKELCFFFVLQNKNIDLLIIGIDNFNQLKELKNIKKKFQKYKYKNFKFKITDYKMKFILPSKWKL